MSWEANKKYEASIDEYGLGQTSKGTPYVWVTFITPGCDGAITWRGWLSSKAKINTYKVLLRMGWTEDLQALSSGPQSKALNLDKDFEIETTLEEWVGQDGEKKSRIAVKWVNDPATVGREKLAAEKLFLLSQTLKGDLALLREQEKNEKRLPPQVAETKTTSVEADVPF